MAVGANHVACGDLVEYRLPFSVGEVRGDVEVLRPEVVELQDNRIGFATVSAGSRAEELEEVSRPFRDERPFSLDRVCDITLLVPRVVLSFVGGSAGTAVVVSLATRLSAPGEVGGELVLAAASASSGRVDLYGHERMFALQPDDPGRALLARSVESRCSTGSGAVW
jgi:hypothetical protein